MARPKRAIPREQGSIKNIWKLFFEPLFIYKPEDMQFKDWADIIFHLKERDITQYRAKRDFKMPGLLYLSSMVKIQGLGGRQVLENAYLMMRHDVRDDFWDVEFFGGTGGKEQVFHLTEREWNHIKLNLEEVPPRGMRKRSRRKL